ncbi:MAG: FAD-dependent oxidoreductase [Chloroflexota bacterium]
MLASKSKQQLGKNDLTGAVMVVGGGIAGMQAALDLGEQGFKVYLTETKTAIGGKMAQLDKTFPTNDCAMCTISPKLVEIGRHPNIKIMTNTDVLGLHGSAGDFTVQVQHRPRYIDQDKCVACNDCTDVCPVIIPDPFNESLNDRRAAYKLYPQAVPNAYAIEKRGIAPCRDACPAGQRAQGYIALIREGRWDDALRVIKMDNPFPGICGRICNHRCETACNRDLVDEPINIRALKRFVTDKVYQNPRESLEALPITKSQKVAIIGAGPCGLTAAQDLAIAGYPVSVFEAMPVAGGMLRLGVPEYRLPTEIIEREVEDILDLGVDLKLNHRIQDLDTLFDDGFEAILIAVGAHEGIKLPIPGADLSGVVINTHFLRDVRLGKYDNGEAMPLGEKVLILGGGNVAIDCARSAVRMGKQVQMACLESREGMPAHQWEIEATLEEGIAINNDRTFEQIIGDSDGKVIGVECSQVASFEFDETGRLQLEKVSDSKHLIECDTVIFSVGQRAGLAFLPDDAGVGLTDSKAIAINPNTYAATRPGVFAAGDSVSGTAFVIEAVDSGHKAAESIIRFLQGSDLEPAPKPDLPVVHFSDAEIHQKMTSGEITKSARVPLTELPVADRINNFAEVEAGYSDEAAMEEAARCLSCGICSECMSCVFVCQKDAINHDEVASVEEINVGALILAPGYQIYNAQLSEEYGLGRYPNVVTSLQYERMLSASGPTSGHVRRPSDDQSPKRIAFLQCVGSRDQSHDYCSSVCCMYAAKEAIMTIEHARAEARTSSSSPDVECQVFFMDTRSYSKGYEEYYSRAEKKYGVKYTRCRLSDIKQAPNSKNLLVRFYSPDEQVQSVEEKEFDLVVLSVGMEISESVKDLGHSLGVELDDYGFCHTTLFDPLQTSKDGIFVAGPFREPKDIPETVVEASGAAASAAQLLSPARFSLTEIQEYPPERDIKSQEPRLGVFVCHCGSNIGGYLDVPGVAEYARGLPFVVHAEDNLYTCSQDSIAKIIETTVDLALNRVVVASCTPITHEPLFQDAIRQAGLNPYLFEMANIRNQCSWVHPNDWDAATEKSKSLIRMAVAKAAQLRPIYTDQVPVNHAALILGGGAAGMAAALNLANQGFPVHLVENQEHLGGNLRNLSYFEPKMGADLSAALSSPIKLLENFSSRITEHPLIDTYLNAELEDTDGFMGNFQSKIVQNGETITVKHGAIIVATGGQEYRGTEYQYGDSPNILTQLEFEKHLNSLENNQSNGHAPGSVVMIQCVGPAEDYCSRICCTTALKNALKLKEIHPQAKITIIYRDIRTFGFKERLYTRAREAGVLFIHYNFDHKPEVKTFDDTIEISVTDPILKRQIVLKPDLLVLSTPVIPSSSAEKLATQLKLSTGADGFFLEAHVKLRPVDFTADGVFMAGMAHYPKFIDETIAQAQAAASRAAVILSKETIRTNARIAVVDPEKCVGCLTCVRICPYNVPAVTTDFSGVGSIQGAAYIEPAVCHGCGSCTVECPANAIQLTHYLDLQMMPKIDALFNKKPRTPTLVPITTIKVKE